MNVARPLRTASKEWNDKLQRNGLQIQSSSRGADPVYKAGPNCTIVFHVRLDTHEYYTHNVMSLGSQLRIN